MKTSTTRLLSRVGLFTLGSVAFTSLGCSLLVTFDDSKIPTDETGSDSTTGDTSSETAADTSTDVASDTKADTSADVADVGVDAADTSVADTSDAEDTIVVAETGDETSTGDAADAEETDGAVATGSIYVRVAALSPGFAGVDLCAVPTPVSGSADFTAATPLASSVGGIPFQTITAYLTLPAAQYTVRVVAAGSTNCNTEIASGSTYALTSIPANTYATFVAYGPASAFAFTTLIDELPPGGSTPSGVANTRVFNALPIATGTNAIDVGVDLGGSPTVVWADIPYGSAVAGSIPQTDGGHVDSDGYLPIPDGDLSLLSLGPLEVVQTGLTSPKLVDAATTLPSDSLLTSFAYKTADGDGAFILCNDTTTPIYPTVFTSNCTIITAPVVPDAGPEAGAETGTETGGSETGSETSSDAGSETIVIADPDMYVRIADFANAPVNMDICVAPTPSGGAADFTSVAPVLAGEFHDGDGIAFKTVTSYLGMPAGTYTLRLVEAASSDCNTELVAGTTYPLATATAGTYITLVAYNAGSSATFAATPLIDDAKGATGDVLVRLFHGVTGGPALDVGLVSGSALGTTLGWKDLPYGSAASGAAPTLGHDANNYVEIANVLTADIPALGAAATGTTSPLLLDVNVSLTSNTLLTAYAFLDSDEATPVVMLCDDTTPVKAPSGLTSTCQQLTAIAPPADAGTGDVGSTTEAGTETGATETGSDETGDASTTSTETGSDETGGDAAGETGPAADTNIHLRFAQLSSEIATGVTAIDFCVVPTPTTGSPDFSTTTPYLGTNFHAAVPFETITGYLALPATNYSFVVVPAGSTDCNTVLDAIDTTLTAGEYATFVADGTDTNSDFGIDMIVDDSTTGSASVAATPTAGAVTFRFFNAVDGEAKIDVGVPSASGGLADPLWVALPFGSATAGSFLTGADANEYLTGPNDLVTPITAVAGFTNGDSDEGSTTPPLFADGITITGSTLLSGFAYGGGDGTTHVQVCNDTTTQNAPADFTSSCATLTALP